MRLIPLQYWLFSVLFLGGCGIAPHASFLGSQSRAKTTYSEVQKVNGETSENGVTTGAFSATSAIAQTMEAGASELAGTSITIEPGSLAVDTSISIETGSSLANANNEAELGLEEGNTLKGASEAVVILPEAKTDPTSPFTIALPIGETSLTMNDYDLLVVIYKVTKFSEDERVYSGLLTGDEISIIDGKAQFKSSYFGSFQLAYTSIKVEEAVEVESKSEILTKNREEEIKATAPSIESLSLTASTDKDLILVEASLPGDYQASFSCIALIDEDKVSPYLARLRSEESMMTFSDKLSTYRGKTLYSQINCIDESGYVMSSEWSAALDLSTKQQTSNTVKEPIYSLSFVVKNLKRKIFIEDENIPRTINFSHDGDYIECSEDGGVTFTACSAKNQLTWSVAKYNETHVVRLMKNNEEKDRYTFVPSSLYPGLSFKTCTQNINANISTAELATFVSPNAVICLEDGVTIDTGANGTLNITTSDVTLIARGNHNALLTSTTGVQNPNIWIQSGASNVNLVGLKFRNTTGGAGYYAVQASSAGSGITLQDLAIDTENNTGAVSVTYTPSLSIIGLYTNVRNSESIYLWGDNTSVDIEKYQTVTFGSDAYGLYIKAGASANLRDSFIFTRDATAIKTYQDSSFAWTLNVDNTTLVRKNDAMIADLNAISLDHNLMGGTAQLTKTSVFMIESHDHANYPGGALYLNGYSGSTTLNDVMFYRANQGAFDGPAIYLTQTGTFSSTLLNAADKKVVLCHENAVHQFPNMFADDGIADDQTNFNISAQVNGGVSKACDNVEVPREPPLLP